MSGRCCSQHSQPFAVPSPQSSSVGKVSMARSLTTECSAERQRHVESLPEGSAFRGAFTVSSFTSSRERLLRRWGRQALTSASLFLVETQLHHPTKDIIWEIFLGMCNCAENVFVLQTRGNGVAIWCGICSSNKHSSRGRFSFSMFSPLDPSRAVFEFGL